MSLFEITGTVEAPDGSAYQPRYIGGWRDAAHVLDTIRSGCHERGDGYRLRVARLDTGTRVALYTQTPQEATP